MDMMVRDERERRATARQELSARNQKRKRLEANEPTPNT